MNVTSCAFNYEHNDMIAYSGNEMLFIRTANFPPLTQKMQGHVAGFRGNKLFIQHDSSLNTIDVSQTTTMMKFIEKRDYRNAYQLSCLGASNNDFKVLGIEALNNQEFEIAMKCFQRV